MAQRFATVQDILDYVAGFTRTSYEEFLDPLSERFAYYRAPTKGEHRGDPTVLVLGNHSSGKSTFVNHVLGKEVQRTGLAPIDDGFTILSYGDEDEKEGHAIVTNPDLPFGDLEKFGPSFISHFKMKSVPAPFLKGISLIDSPGMIDAADGELGRGYDFISAVRWFVERADVVLVFFDPDKPGTTGETLHVFTSALLDIDHKLLIILNKMDQFRTLRDFARAYGALCWNLSKIIPRKDLPMIYNTYVPVEGAPKSALPLSDFAAAREEVVHEIRRAPARRIDNVLTRLHDHARKLRMQARVFSSAARSVRNIRLQFLAIGFLAFLVGLAGAWLTYKLEQSWYISLAVVGGGLFVGVATHYFGRWQAKVRSREFETGLTGVFESVYYKDLALSGGADDLRAQWMSVKDRALKALKTVGLHTIRPLSSAEEARIEDIIKKKIPSLRSEVHNAIRDLGPLGGEEETPQDSEAPSEAPPETSPEPAKSDDKAEEGP
jgi:hypothetical protein